MRCLRALSTASLHCVCCSGEQCTSQVLVGTPSLFARLLSTQQVTTNHLKVAFWDNLHLWFQVGMLLGSIAAGRAPQNLPHRS